MEVKYVSAEKYSKMTGLGVEEVKRLCRTGQLEHFRTEKGYYKIKVVQDGVPKEQYDKVVQENIVLKTIYRNVMLLFKQFGEVN